MNTKMTNSNVEARSAQVPEQLERLFQAVDELDNSISLLINQLEPVIREEVEDKSLPEDEESLVAVAHNIRSSTDRVVVMMTRVSSVRSRLEI